MAKENRVNTLFLDDWAYVPLYEKAVHGGLTLHDFFGGYLEHRPAIARVIAIVTTLVSKGDVRWQCIVTFCAITLTWINCGLLLHRALGGWRRVWLAWGMMGWVMFCPVQWQEFLWPSCHMDTLPLLFLTSSLLVLGRERMNFWLRLGLCGSFAWLATYSFAAGLTLWVLVPLAAACGYGFPEVAHRKRFLLTWSVPMTIVLFCYFHGLKNEMESPFAYGQGNADTMTHSLVAVLKSPEKGLKFAVTLVGSNLARGILGSRGNVAFWLGVLATIVFAFGLAVVWARWKHLPARRATLPFAVIALYGLSVAGMVASGRAWASKDVGGALNNRYACFASAFVAGVVGLLCVEASSLVGSQPLPGTQTLTPGVAQLVPVIAGREAKRKRWLADHAAASVKNFAMPLGGVLCGLLFANWCYGANMMKAWHSARLRGAADIHFSRMLGPSRDRGQNAQHIRLAYERAVTMDKLGFLEHPLATTLDLDQFDIKSGGLDKKLGLITGTEREADSIIIRGYALQSMSGRPADGILITYSDEPDQNRKIVEVVLPDSIPALFSEGTTKDWQYVVLDEYRPKLYGQWTATIRRDALPKGKKLHIEAWVLNIENMTVKEIVEGFTINN
ncbi:hypothetical protein AYO49_00485 [Verrucomicrobiaceae bacterium SCGC AG-212-N21]|nr:hypothetical protein AYO49_00485 [Verrucomicrobiaceae bacterium SCGC AG-212-N21]